MSDVKIATRESYGNAANTVNERNVSNERIR